MQLTDLNPPLKNCQSWEEVGVKKLTKSPRVGFVWQRVLKKSTREEIKKLTFIEIILLNKKRNEIQMSL